MLNKSDQRFSFHCPLRSFRSSPGLKSLFRWSPRGKEGRREGGGGAGLWSSFSHVASDSRQLDVIVAELQPAHRTPVNDTVREGGRGGWGSGDESRHVFQYQMRVLRKKEKKKRTQHKQTWNHPSHPTWTGLQD